jgi:hypothetical protein
LLRIRWANLRTGELTCLSEGNETRAGFGKEARLLEALARFSPELALNYVTIRNTEDFFSLRKEIAFRLEGDLVRQVVSESGAELGFTYATRKELLKVVSALTTTQAQRAQRYAENCRENFN